MRGWPPSTDRASRWSGNHRPRASPASVFCRCFAAKPRARFPEDSERLTVVSIAGGKATGTLVGGCLLDFIFTIGTPWEPDLDGSIFFFEDSGSGAIQVDRALLYLEQLGKFDDVRGIVAGELAGCEWDNFKTAPRSKTLEEVLTGRLGELGVPVLYNLPLGHGASLATLPLGVQATVDAEANTLTIDEPALAES